VYNLYGYTRTPIKKARTASSSSSSLVPTPPSDVILIPVGGYFGSLGSHTSAILSRLSSLSSSTVTIAASVECKYKETEPKK